MSRNNIIRKVFILAGFCLIAGALILLFVWQWNIHRSQQTAKELVRVIQEQIPEPQGAVLEERRENAMATLSVNGTDFVGLLELPQYESILPICANGEKTAKYPCRLSGSVYDRTLQIGATSQKGQYDFYRDISVGDPVFFTDMEGNRYAYTVTDVRNEKNADQATLQRKEASLTLLIKNVYAFEYIVLYCDVLN